LYDHDDQAIRQKIKGYSFTDKETRGKIREVYDEFGYVSDPHTAVGLLAAEHYSEDFDSSEPKIVLSTAHPSKFSDVVEEEISEKVTIPERLLEATTRKEVSQPMNSDYVEFKKTLLKNYG
jgi:threonine synthase